MRQANFEEFFTRINRSRAYGKPRPANTYHIFFSKKLKVTCADRENAGPSLFGQENREGVAGNDDACSFQITIGRRIKRRAIDADKKSIKSAFKMHFLSIHMDLPEPILYGCLVKSL